MSILEEFSSSSSKTSKQVSTTGKIFIAITGGVAVGLTLICAPFVSPALRKVCLPYVPATTVQIENILIALKGKSGKLIDLGSGDGRIVLETARKKFTAHGVELNPWLVLYSKLDAFRNGLSGTTKFYRKDLWKFNIKPYNNVIIFGVEEMMADLEHKIQQECVGGTSIVACRFPLPNLTPQNIIGTGIDTVWIYEIKNN